MTYTEQKQKVELLQACVRNVILLPTDHPGYALAHRQLKAFVEALPCAS